MAIEKLGLVDEALARREKYARFAYQAPAQRREGIDFQTPEIKARIEARRQQIIAEHIERHAQKEARVTLSEIGHLGLPTTDVLIALVADVTGTAPADIIGPRRCRTIAWPRHLAIWLIKRVRWDMSLPQIGRAFRRDHTTILSAMKNVRRHMHEAPFAEWMADPRIQVAGGFSEIQGGPLQAKACAIVLGRVE